MAQQFSDTAVPWGHFPIAVMVAKFQVVIWAAPVGTILSACIGLRFPWHSSASPMQGTESHFPVPASPPHAPCAPPASIAIARPYPELSLPGLLAGEDEMDGKGSAWYFPPVTSRPL